MLSSSSIHNFLVRKRKYIPKSNYIFFYSDQISYKISLGLFDKIKWDDYYAVIYEHPPSLCIEHLPYDDARCVQQLIAED